MSSEFETLQRDAKILAAEGRLFESLKKFEKARKIKETPKILQRIQKLKDFIAENGCKENSGSNSEGDRKTKELCAAGEQSSEHQKTTSKLAVAKETAKVSHQIQNVKDFKELPPGKESDFQDFKLPKQPKQHIPKNHSDLSSEDLKSFNKLKKKAMELSYLGNFEDSLEYFAKALEICACPKVQKHYHDIKAMASEHGEKLKEIQNLTNTGKKLAKTGNQMESLKKLKDAYAVCPSPSISKMIRALELQSSSKSSPVKEAIPFELNYNPSMSKIETPKSVNSRSSKYLPVTDTIPSVSDDNCSTPEAQTHKSDSSEHQERIPSICDDPDALSPEQLRKYKALYEKARADAGEGKLQEALKALLEAKSICPSNKILKRLKALQEHIEKTAAGDEDDDQMVAVADDFYIFHEIYEKLYPYQREGVAWMWELFKKKKGGILGDDMGLGKTFQVIAFLSGLIDANKVKHIIIIMPVSLIPNWEKEFKKWCPGISVNVFHGGTKGQKERCIMRAQRRGHVLLTSYGMVLGNLDKLIQLDGRDYVWDYVILDEGHKIKNPNQTTKAVHGILSKNRLVLSGTPIQNNLAELWALFDFAHQGTLLGSMKTFKMTYETTITRAREKDATAGEKRLGTEMADNLKKLIEPYFLRRTKAEVWKNTGQGSDVNNLENDMQNLCIENKLGRKNDLIMWVCLSELQCEIYQNFLHSYAVKTILVSKRSPLVELTILKKICDHPRLLSHRACLQLGLNGQLSEEDLAKELEDESSYASSIENVSDETLIAESGKMKFLINLLENLKADGHRTLVFSLSRKILDMIHRILLNRNWKVMRIDGTITKIEERERRIQLFQKDSSYPVFLLTTQVGGVGITLTAADRVIIYDPSWNPATDAQAVDRVYRIGQKKNVVVYRLITCGSVEEKIYRRQVFKDSITRQATGASDPYRYFSKQELRELFSLDNPHHSATQVQLSEMHSDGRQSDTMLDEHIAFLHSLNIFGISDHDLMFSKSAVDHTEDNDEGAVSQDFIKKQVLMAQARIKDEAAVVEEGIRLAGAYARPFSEPIKTFKSNLNKDSYIPPTFPEVIDNEKDINPTISSTDNQSISYHRNAESLSLQSIQSSKRNSTAERNSLAAGEKITSYFSKTLKLTSRERNSSSYPEKYDSDLPVFSKSLSMHENSLQKSLNVSNKQDSQKNISIVDISSDELESSDEGTTKSTEKRYSFVKSGQFSAAVSSTSTPLSKNASSPIKDNSSKLLTQNTSVGIPSEENKTKQIVSNQKDHSILANSYVSNQSNLHSSMNIERNSSIKVETIGGVANESQFESDKLNVSVKSESEILEPSKVHGHSSIAQLADDSMNVNFERNASLKVETIDDVISDSLFEPDDLNVSEKSGSEVLETNKTHGHSFLAQSADGSINVNEDCEMENIENSFGETKCNSSDIPEENISSRSAFDKYRPSNTMDTPDDSDEESIGPTDSSKSDTPDQSLLQDVLGIKTPVLSRNDSSLIKEVPCKNTNILEDISFDEKPILKKNSRKSCAKVQNFVCESDSSYGASCPSSVNNSDDEIIPESDIDKSDILDTSSIVPSSIPNSPFASKNKAQMNRSFPLSNRITPLRLRKSYVLPSETAFARALAESPVFELDNFQHANTSKSTSLNSTAEIDSPVIKPKRKRIIVSDSEDDVEEQ